METEPLGPIMRNKAQAKLSHGNYPHVSSRFEVQTSTKGQPKDQNSICLAISTPLATRWCGYRASYSGRQSPSSTPLSLKQSCSVPAPCTPRTCRERRIPLEPPKGRRLAKSASDQPSTTGCCSCCLGSPRSATEAAAPQTNATGLLHARAVHAGTFCGPPGPHGAPQRPPAR